jgi:hypothetical protein
MTQLRFEAGEELPFAAIPRDDNFHTRHLPPFGIQPDDLKQKVLQVYIGCALTVILLVVERTFATRSIRRHAV